MRSNVATIDGAIPHLEQLRQLRELQEAKEVRAFLDFCKERDVFVDVDQE